MIEIEVQISKMILRISYSEYYIVSSNGKPFFMLTVAQPNTHFDIPFDSLKNALGSFHSG